MLDKIIKLEKLEKAKDDYIKRDVPEGGMDEQDAMNVGFFMITTIEALKTLTDEVVKLKAKVKKLEQQNSYYPTEEEINSIKVGGTD